LGAKVGEQGDDAIGLKRPRHIGSLSHSRRLLQPSKPKSVAFACQAVSDSCSLIERVRFLVVIHSSGEGVER
jgi:hypothetical protein